MMWEELDEDLQPDLDGIEFNIDNDEDLDEDMGLFDHVCAFCDNGGEVLWCEGPCMRSFHPTKASGAESLCESLGFSDAKVEAMPLFLCDNCKYKQHQCFACGGLGSSDKSSGSEVFLCSSGTCGHFYHPYCVVELLHLEDRTYGEELQRRIAAGETFTCPIHKCIICRQGENKEVEELRFAICRRCPTAYHRKCLPREISFEALEEENIMQRAWEGLLPYRILIYCLKHKIRKDILTPNRDHLIFPHSEERDKKSSQNLHLSKGKVVAVEGNVAFEDPAAGRITGKKRKHVGNVCSALKNGGSLKKGEKSFYGWRVDCFKKPKVADASRMSLKDKSRCLPTSVNNFFSARQSNESSREKQSNLLLKKSESAKKMQQELPRSSLRERITSKLVIRNSSSFKLNLLLKQSEAIKGKKQEVPCRMLGKPIPSKPVIRNSSSSKPLVDADMIKRILTLKQQSASSVTSNEIEKKPKCLTSTYFSSSDTRKLITQGRVEALVRAVRNGLETLEKGGNIADAKAVCGPKIIDQLMKWRVTLNTYIAPFLHGMRYTSFGRHFTKVDKLKEIVDKLHWYVEDGDTIVDFCCGANDFSCLMKEKLEATGKICSFKNYDIIQPKNDFSFEKRDWFTVTPEDLPTGSKLIMGLNPPFGCKAALANKFISQALKFKPKLLILIVPKETKRLDKKGPGYDLIWEDENKFSGKSFYLPGSVDVNDKQMEQWNLKPPPLYLWSHPDWTKKHQVIAHRHGHRYKMDPDVRGPRPGFHADAMGYMIGGSIPEVPGPLMSTGSIPEVPGPRPGFHADAMGFMIGSEHPLPYQNGSHSELG
ncbi:protein ENHANCED DOWNY MILDEW 2-like [Telopea speciosissima]|uniref:protein ENHANCED DOWNY MILDEW 2-like n=1 Tax=Telopea speciosissima TaxID=54955 RepID=UPI001CC5EF67|nr:protein ENHANCED DOWNY MILDEW 2-like [Telopea speciosissima]